MDSVLKVKHHYLRTPWTQQWHDSSSVLSFVWPCLSFTVRVAAAGEPTFHALPPPTPSPSPSPSLNQPPHPAAASSPPSSPRWDEAPERQMWHTMDFYPIYFTQFVV
ncbi:uncharacterized protein LOC125374338 [Haliotis rufescens]|uniref:uncharacterized protein LOC125374338 n=1 Tax=Haliotis rufescens TaxID=6454 RepID=UPI00201F1F15|nr:uncharacterized protein LOC125374338 [Haliotis rufescens]